MRFTINGSKREAEPDIRASLLDLLREDLGLTGTKKGCDHGQCGACTVHVDGQRVNACLTLALTTEGSKVTTIEGLTDGSPTGALHPMQEAFIKHDGFQCGYCTPGQIMSAVALLEQTPKPTDDDINSAMSGNICRCATYVRIRSAIHAAATTMEG